MLIGLLSLCFGVNSCSHSKYPGGNPFLEAAIEDYVSGRTEKARGELERLTATLEDDELALAYLYLGRCLLDEGDLEKAAEAFTRGGMLEPDGPFESYLEEVRRKAFLSSKHLTEADHLTRAELSCVLVHFAGSTGALASVPVNLPRDCATHWARAEITKAIACGYMAELPDGGFHPDEKVSRAAFLFICARMISSSSGGRIRIHGSFPEGIALALETLTGASIGEDLGDWVTGGEVADFLQGLKECGKRNAE